ncbi:hypothetical protein Q31a_07360 [Aureliella helgolandensis]|uniref:Uncharacterized protein n=1 Tax=Aureliella helgolandensis TaxID=2527968 RepID=A0A518G1H4_9BACT|nr:hypothetical protein Q31a_07360 [Aureliella helgolandensis]
MQGAPNARIPEGPAAMPPPSPIFLRVLRIFHGCHTAAVAAPASTAKSDHARPQESPERIAGAGSTPIGSASQRYVSRQSTQCPCTMGIQLAGNCSKQAKGGMPRMASNVRWGSDSEQVGAL